MEFSILFFTHLLNGLLMVLLPILLGIYLTRRYRLGWRLFWIGAATFILSQVGHIPFNGALGLLFQRGILPQPSPPYQVLVSALILGLSAGLWEELVRYATYRWWAKDARTWSTGVLLGTGHGGAEAIILGLLVLVGFVNMLILRSTDLSTILPAEQVTAVQQQVANYWSFPWPYTLLGAVERLFALPVQVACAVLVLQVFVRRQSFWLWLAVGWHSLVDAVSVYTVRYWGLEPPGAYYIEGIIGLFALASLGIIFALRQPETETHPEPEAPPASPRPPPPWISPKEETEENLEQTRFN